MKENYRKPSKIGTKFSVILNIVYMNIEIYRIKIAFTGMVYVSVTHIKCLLVNIKEFQRVV